MTNEGPRRPSGGNLPGRRARVEPEHGPSTRCFAGRLQFVINYHSAAQMLLYGVGWQVSTPSRTTDRDTLAATTPTRRSGYTRGLGPALHEQRRHRHTRPGPDRGSARARVSTCRDGRRDRPTDKWEPADVRAASTSPTTEADPERVLKNLPFALSVARSAADPTNPVSSVAVRRPTSRRPVRLVIRHVSRSRSRPSARCAAYRLRYTINNGPAQSAPATPWRGGQKYGAGSTSTTPTARHRAQHALRDKVTVWFTASAPQQHAVHLHGGGPHRRRRAGARAEDSPASRGQSPTGAPRPGTRAHVDALRAAGYTADVYDLDTTAARRRTRSACLALPGRALGDRHDIIPRAAGQPGGTTTRGRSRPRFRP